MRRVIAVIFLLASQSAGAIEIGALIGPVVSAPTNMRMHQTSASPKGEGSVGLVGGLYFSHFSFPVVDLEYGAYLARRSLNLFYPAATNVVTRFSSVHVPLLVRIQLPFLFSVAAGPFANFGYGKPTVDSVETSFSGASLNSKEFGLLASARFRYSFLPMVGLILDLRFKRGLTSLMETASLSLRSNEFEILFGASLGL